MIEILGQNSLFKGLEGQQLEDIADLSSRTEYDDGDFLIREDDKNTDLYILCEGSVEIVSNNTAKTSSEVVLSSEDKDVFGEINWLTNSKRTAGVRCHGPVDAIRINGEALMNYLENNPEVGFKVTRRIARLLSARMEESNRLLKQILWNEHI